MAVLLGTSPVPATDGNGSTQPSDKLNEENSSKGNDEVSTATNESSSVSVDNAAVILPPPAATADLEPIAKPAIPDESRQQPRAPHGLADNSETDSADEIGASNVANAETNVVITNSNPNLHSNGNVGQVCD